MLYPKEVVKSAEIIYDEARSLAGELPKKVKKVALWKGIPAPELWIALLQHRSQNTMFNLTLELYFQGMHPVTIPNPRGQAEPDWDRLVPAIQAVYSWAENDFRKTLTQVVLREARKVGTVLAAAEPDMSPNAGLVYFLMSYYKGTARSNIWFPNSLTQRLLLEQTVSWAL